MTAHPLSGKQRSFFRGLALTLGTLGLYALYWHYKAFKEVFDQDARMTFPLVAWVLLLVPLTTVLGLIWLSVMGIMTLNHARRSLGMRDGVSPGEFLAWVFVGMLILVGPFIGYYRLQTSMNEYWAAAGKAPRSSLEGIAFARVA